MDLVGADKAKKEFEELLAATWAEQIAHLSTPRDSGDSQVRPDAHDTTGKEENIEMNSGKETYVASTVKAGDRAYAIRNEHEMPASPQSTDGAIEKTVKKGESL